MKNIKITFSFLVAVSVIALAPSAAFALTGSSAGSTAGTASASASPSLSAQSAGTSAGTATLNAQSAGTSASASPSPSLSAQSAGTSAGTATLNGQSAGTSAGTATLNPQSAGTSAGTATLNGQSAGTSAGTQTTNPDTGSGSNPGGNGGGGGSGFVSTGGGGGSFTPATSCQIFTSFMKIGASYPVAEVVKLQNFLKNSENINVAITGVFDLQTYEAVKVFQAKYPAQVLAPWGISEPTGYVYITTLKTINSRVCNTPLTLTPEELAIINAAKARQAEGFSEVFGSTSNTNPNITSPSPSTIGGIAINSTSTDDQVAAAGSLSIWGKIWNFIKRIFGR